MPGRKSNKYHEFSDDPDYANLSAVYNKTGTTEEDWEPFRQEVEVWYVQNDQPNFKLNTAKELESPFIVQLSRRINEQHPIWFEGLNQDGILNTVTKVARRVCSNYRRSLKGDDSGSPTPSDTISSSSPSTQRRSSQSVGQLVMDGGAFNPWLLGVQATYRGNISCLTLSDVAQSAWPELTPANLLERLTLDIFVKPFKEDLGIANVQVELWFEHPTNPPCKMSLDRQIRGHINVFCRTNDKGQPMFFTFLPIKGPQPLFRPAAAIQYSSE